VTPDDVDSSEVFSRLPVTSRKELFEQSPRFLGVGPDQIVETVMTAGTTGKPFPFVFTRSDIDRIAFSQALSLYGAGLTVNDRVLLLVSLDRFSLDGMALYRGAGMMGVNVMRMGCGSAQSATLQRYLQFFRPTVLIAAPSVLRNVATELGRAGVDTAKSNVAKLIATSEALRSRDMELSAPAKTIETLWGARAFSMYSSTELAVTYGECGARCGAHSHPELVYTEIVDENGDPVADGEAGELVATPLGVEGVPLLRYRTGDITFKVPGTCSCGRNSCRIGPILGRVGQNLHTARQFSYRGVDIVPQQLTRALDAIGDVRDYVIIIEKDERGADTVLIHAAVPPAALEKISSAIREATGVHIQTLVSNEPTIRALRGGVTTKLPIIDKRTTPVAATAG
jgi:phenylacetate-CoA ligase